MDVFNAIEARRAIKLFDPTVEIPPKDEQKMLDAARLAPTAFNMQNWRFVIVRDKGLRQKIRELAWDQPQMTDASLLVVICADLKAWKKDPARYWRHAPGEFGQQIVDSMLGFYEGREQTQVDEAMRSVSMAAMNMMLAAQALGYDSCPLDGFDFDGVAQLVHLPEDNIIGLIVTIGKKREDVWPRGSRMNDEEIIFTDRFGD